MYIICILIFITMHSMEKAKDYFINSYCRQDCTVIPGLYLKYCTSLSSYHIPFMSVGPSTACQTMRVLRIVHFSSGPYPGHPLQTAPILSS